LSGDPADQFTVNFSAIVTFFNRMSALRGVKKSAYVKEFLKTIFKKSRKPLFTFSIIRLLLPGDDKDRGNYGLK
jgi:DNA ligase-4